VACLVGVKAGRAYTCVLWLQVTLCDLIWQVTLRSSEVVFFMKKSYIIYPFHKLGPLVFCIKIFKGGI